MKLNKFLFAYSEINQHLNLLPMLDMQGPYCILIFYYEAL